MILLLILILSRSTLYLLFVFLSPFSVPEPSSNINGISCRSIFCDIIEVIGIRPLLFPDDSPFLVVFVSDGLDALVVVAAAVDFWNLAEHRWPSELATWQIMGLPETGIVMLLLFWLKGPELGELVVVGWL